MKKMKENLTAVGFYDERTFGVMRGRLSKYGPFQKNGKLGVRQEESRNIVIEAAYTHIEAFAIDCDVFFIVGNEGKYGLYDEEREIIPVQYEQIVKVSNAPKIFLAYTDVDNNQFDIYWAKGVLAKGGKEYIIKDFNVKVKYIDEQQELFSFIGDYETDIIIRKGKYDIQLHKDYMIIVENDKQTVYNYKGCKVSEDVSGSYVQCGDYLVHVTKTAKKFYNAYGKEVDLRERYEDVVEADEYVLAKRRGHWRVIYTV